MSLPRLLAGFALLLFALVLMRPLLPVDETRYLAVAWEMQLSGDPFHLTRNFASYSHKPPLLFWLINLVWGVTGVSELAGRLVAPAFGVATLAATAGLGRAMWPEDRATGLMAAAVLAGFSVFQIYASTTMFDTMLTLAVVGGIAALWRIGQTAGVGRGSWAALGLMLAFGTYAKGPVILVHLLPPLLLMRFWAPSPPTAMGMVRGFGLALLVALALVALWLVPTLLTADAAFRHELLWSQSVDRVSGGMAHDRPIWFLALLLPVILFPWVYCARFWRALPGLYSHDAAARLCLIWATSGLVLFSFVSSKQAHYLLPELPALALVLGRALAGQGRDLGRGASLAPWLVVAMGAGLGLVATGLVKSAAGGGLHGLPVVALALGLIALGVWGRQLPVLTGHLMLGAAVTVALHLYFLMSGQFDGYDSRRLAVLLSPAGDGQLAFTGGTYNAEVNFTARYHLPVATPRTAADLVAWAVAHPDGLVFGPVPTAPIPVPPQETIDFGSDPIGIWPASAALTARE